MNSKKTDQTPVRDLRNIDPVKVAVPDVSGELAGLETPPGAKDARIVTPGVGVQTPGQTTHE